MTAFFRCRWFGHKPEVHMVQTGWGFEPEDWGPPQPRVRCARCHLPLPTVLLSEDEL